MQALSVLIEDRCSLLFRCTTVCTHADDEILSPEEHLVALCSQALWQLLLAPLLPFHKHWLHAEMERTVAAGPLCKLSPAHSFQVLSPECIKP